MEYNLRVVEWSWYWYRSKVIKLSDEYELEYINKNSTLKLNWMNGLNVNQLNVNNWYWIMNISVNPLKSNVNESE